MAYNAVMGLTVKGIVVHLSASKWGDATAIRSWHLARGWHDIGYHAVILNGLRQPGQEYQEVIDGKIEPGRKVTVAGAHCKEGGANSVTLGVCLVGTPGFVPEGPDTMKSGPIGRVCVRPYMTVRQFGALVHVLATWCKIHKLDPLGTFVHQGVKRRVISQHSEWEPRKPYCASLNTRILAKLVAKAMKEEAPA